MKLYDLGELQGNYVGNGEFTADEFSEWDIERLERFELDVVFYWYAQGSYCGSGNLIARKDGKWYLHDCGHCSCYGPIENVELTAPYDSLDALEDALSDHYAADVMPLVKAARSKRYK